MKTVVVTGASRGIGLATANRFLKEGWKVLGTFNHNEVPINSDRFTAVKLDLGSEESIQRASEDIKHQTESIDALVNNAGIILDGHDEYINLQKARETMDVDLFAIMSFTDKLLPLLDRDGHIVNINSQYGAFSFPMDSKSSTGYRLAKATLNMYTRILSFHLQERGIVVSSLDPGWVKTDMGLDVATETTGPDRDPEDPANDIYQLISNVSESGFFWRFGEKREW